MPARTHGTWDIASLSRGGRSFFMVGRFLTSLWFASVDLKHDARDVFVLWLTRRNNNKKGTCGIKSQRMRAFSSRVLSPLIRCGGSPRSGNLRDRSGACEVKYYVDLFGCCWGCYLLLLSSLRIILSILSIWALSLSLSRLLSSSCLSILARRVTHLVSRALTLAKT